MQRGEKTYHKSPINPKPKPKQQQHELKLIQIRPNDTRPQPQPRSKAIRHPERQRQNQHVPVRKRRLDEVRHDHLADRVRVDESDEQDERDEVVVPDLRVEAQVRGDQAPGAEGREQAEEWAVRGLAALAPHGHDVGDAGCCAEEEHDPAVHEPPVRERHVVHCVWEEREVRDAQGREHRVVPKAAAALDCCEEVDDAEGQDAFDGT